MKTQYWVKVIVRKPNMTTDEYWDEVNHARVHYMNGINELRKFCGNGLHYCKNGDYYVKRAGNYEFMAGRC